MLDPPIICICHSLDHKLVFLRRRLFASLIRMDLYRLQIEERCKLLRLKASMVGHVRFQDILSRLSHSVFDVLQYALLVGSHYGLLTRGCTTNGTCTTIVFFRYSAQPCESTLPLVGLSGYLLINIINVDYEVIRDPKYFIS